MATVTYTRRMRRPRVPLIRTVLLAVLAGLLSLTPAVAIARPPAGGTTAATHHKGWSSQDLQRAAQGRAGTAPTLQRTGPRLEHQLQPGPAGVPGVATSMHRAVTFVGRSTVPAERFVPRAATCPKMRAPPT